jgi:predicted transcriptional regulator
MKIRTNEVYVAYTRNMVYNDTNPLLAKEEVLLRTRQNEGFNESLERDKVNTEPATIGEFTKEEQKIFGKKYFLIEGFCRWTKLDTIPDSWFYVKIAKGVSFYDKAAFFRIQTLNEQRTKKEPLALAKTVFNLSKEEAYANLSRKEFATEIGLSPPTVSNYIQIMSNETAIQMIEEGLINFNIALALLRSRTQTGYTIKALYDLVSNNVEGSLTVTKVEAYLKTLLNITDWEEATETFHEETAEFGEETEVDWAEESEDTKPNYFEEFKKSYDNFDNSVYIAVKEFLERIL